MSGPPPPGESPSWGPCDSWVSAASLSSHLTCIVPSSALAVLGAGRTGGLTPTEVKGRARACWHPALCPSCTTRVWVSLNPPGAGLTCGEEHGAPGGLRGARQAGRQWQPGSLWVHDTGTQPLRWLQAGPHALPPGPSAEGLPLLSRKGRLMGAKDLPRLCGPHPGPPDRSSCPPFSPHPLPPSTSVLQGLALTPRHPLCRRPRGLRAPGPSTTFADVAAPRRSTSRKPARRGPVPSGNPGGPCWSLASASPSSGLRSVGTGCALGPVLGGAGRSCQHAAVWPHGRRALPSLSLRPRGAFPVGWRRPRERERTPPPDAVVTSGPRNVLLSSGLGNRIPCW